MHSYAKRFRYFAVMALSFCAHNAFAQWEQITPENEVVVSVPGGGEKTVYPSCSLPALPGPEGLAPNPFSFYFERGESDGKDPRASEVNDHGRRRRGHTTMKRLDWLSIL